MKTWCAASGDLQNIPDQPVVGDPSYPNKRYFLIEESRLCPDCVASKDFQDVMKLSCNAITKK